MAGDEKRVDAGNLTAEVAGAVDQPEVRSFELTVLEGPRKGLVWHSTSEACSIGSHVTNDLVIDDPTVSRFHCEVRIAEGAQVRDLGSRNGTMVDGVGITGALLRHGSLLRLGSSVLRFQLTGRPNRILLTEDTSFGSLVGGSVAMRHVFALLQRAAQNDVTVLIEGETGTGKSQAAEAIHARSARRNGPFVTVDCASLPATLLESELFGHERGAFTGADLKRVGAFEEASGGTIFIDELGELPLELQPKLLRVIEAREVRRLGGNSFRKIDVRVIAATHRDLRAEVNAGRFRSDLFFRLAVATVRLPALRQRPEDIPALVSQILDRLRADPERAALVRGPETMAQLQAAAWPGNVRELRNSVEQILLFDAPLQPLEPARSEPPSVDSSQPYDQARRLALDAFERAYVESLLKRHGGEVAAAATASGLYRGYLYRLMRRHGVPTSRASASEE